MGFLVPLAQFVATIGYTAAAAVGAAGAISLGAAYAIGGVLLVAGTALAVKAFQAFDVEMPQADSDASRTYTTKGTVQPVKIVYGEALVSGPIVYVGVAGNQNQDLYHAIALTGHVSESINSIYFDDIEITTAQRDSSGNVTSGRYAPVTDVDGVASTTVVRINTHDGTYGAGGQNAARDSMLAAAFGNDWTTAHYGKKISYLVTKFTLPDSEKAGELWDKYTPTNIKAIVKGVNTIYDPRGATSTGWSDNPALCLANYLTDTEFGVGIPTSKIDWDSVEVAADACDGLVNIPTSSTQKAFTCNGVLFGTDSHKTNITKLLSAMNGNLIYSNGKYFIHAGAWIDATESLTENDLRGPVSIKTSVDRQARFNTIKPLYMSPADNYKMMELPPVTITGAITRDNNEVLEKQVQLPMTNNSFMAQRISHQLVSRSSDQRVLTFPANLKGLRIKVGDRVNVTISEFGYSSKTFQCIGWSFSDGDSGGVDLTLIEDTESRYDAPAESFYSTKTNDGTINEGFPGVAPPTSLTATGAEKRITVTWTNPVPASSFSRIYVYAGPNSTFSNHDKVFQVNGNTITEELASGTTRYYWARAVQYGDGSDSGYSTLAGPVNATASTITADAVEWTDVDNKALGIDITDDTITILDTAGSVTGQQVAESGVDAGITLTASGGGIVMNQGGAIKSYLKDSESDTTAGFFLGWNSAANSGNGSYTFGVGNSTDYLKYIDGTLTVSGTLSGVDGDFSGTISIGSNNDIFKADSNGIYLGNATFGSAPFRVTPAGALTATSATITGAITATSLDVSSATVTGTISADNIDIDGVTLDTDGSGNLIIKSGGVDTTQIANNAVDINKIADTLQSTNYSDTAGSEAGWKLTTDGTFIGQDGTFRGAVNATSGTFTGDVSTDAKFIAGSNASTVTLDGTTGANYSIFAGADTSNNASFRVGSDGVVEATRFIVRDDANGQILIDTSNTDNPFSGVVYTSVSQGSGASVETVAGTLDNDTDEITIVTTGAETFTITTKVAIDDNDGATNNISGASTTSTSDAENQLIGADLKVEYYLKQGAGAYAVEDTEVITFTAGTPTTSQIKVFGVDRGAGYGGSLTRYFAVIQAGGAGEVATYYSTTSNANRARTYAVSTGSISIDAAGTHKIKIVARLVDSGTNTTLTTSTTPKLVDGKASGTYGGSGIVLGDELVPDQSSLQDFRRLYEMTSSSGFVVDAADDTFSIGGGSTILTSGGTISGSLVVTGDLSVLGDTTTLTTSELSIEDKNITLNYSTGDSNATADGAGITIQDAVDASNDASILWNSSYDYFNFSHPVGRPLLASGAAAFWTSSNNADITLLRVTSSSDTAYADKSGYGFSLKYIGSGSGNDNSLNLYADNQNNPNQSLAFKVLQDGTMTFSQDATFVGTVTWSGGGSANANTAYTYSQVGHLPLAGGTLSGTLDAAAGLQLSNTNITEVNALSFNDPGPGEGISWSNGNWAIYESPDDLTTNTAGNLQFVSGGSRKVTFNTSGDGYFAGTVNLNNDSAKFAAPVYRGTASSVSNSGYTTLFTVVGGSLGSSIKFNLTGTTGNVVVNVTADLVVGHYQDILITTQSGFYTTVTLKITTDDNEDFAVEATTNHANAVTLYIEVFPQSSETVTFTDSHSYTGSSLTHTATYGHSTSGTGGSDAHIRTDGGVYASDGTTSDVGFGFLNEVDTGMYRPASNQLGLVVDSSRKLQLTSTGAYFQNVALLKHQGTTFETGDGGSNGVIDVKATTNAYFKVNGTTELTLTPTSATFAGSVTTNDEIIVDVPATTGAGTGADTFALLLKNTSVNYTEHGLAAYNAHTSWDMPDSTSFMASSRPTSSSLWTYMAEVNGPVQINRYAQLDDNATHGSGMVQNVFYQYDGAGNVATDMKVPVGELETWATYDGTNGVIEHVSITAAGFVQSKGFGIAGTTVIDASRNLHANGDANLADGAVPNVSGGTAYFPTKMVSPKIVFLNDAGGDDNYIVSNDGNNAYTVNGNTAGVWVEFYGDKTLSNAGLVFDYWKGKGMELSRVGSDSGSTGTTFITIDNDVGSDLSQQKSFIDFVFKDDNSNEYPQVRIGAEVGPGSDANTRELEGTGAFVVYTNNATGVGEDGNGDPDPTPTGLNERFRVSYNGDTTTEGNIKAGQWFRGNSNTNTLYSSTSLGTLVQAPSNSGVGGRVIFRDSDGDANAYVQTDTGQMVGNEFATLNGGNFVGSNLAQTGTTSQTVGVLKSILISHSPEGNHAAHPYLLNDLASCRLRGGTVAFSGLTTNPSDSAIDVIFEPNASNLSVANTNYSGGANSTFTITITPPRSLNYTTYAGISFGSGSFAPSSLKIEFSNDGGTNYTTALDSSIADHNYSAYLNTGSSLINRIRYTIGYPSSSSIRITNIWAYNYNSEGMDHYFLPRKGGVIWGKITVPDGSATAPAYSFNQDTGNGTYLEWYVQNEAKHQVSISTDGVRRAHFNEAGIWTSANFYLSSGGSVRSFDEWLATTGTTGKGFKFTNTVDQVDALTLTAAGNATFAGTISSGAITSTTTAATAIVANRSNAGVVIDIQKNGVSSGSIGTEGTNLAINSAGSGGYGRLQDNGSDVAVWWTNGIYPATDNTKNLGASSTSGRWKNLFMANGIYMNGSQIVDSSRNLTNIGTITTSSTIKVDSSTHAYLTLDNGGAYESGIIFQRAGTSKWEQYISGSLDRMRFYSYGPSLIQMDILDGVDGNGGTILSGLKITDGNGYYGSYGNLILNSTSNYTSTSRGWMITNGYKANQFAILYSSSATTLPSIDTTGGNEATGTSVALKINNTGQATFSALADFDNGITVSVGGSDRLNVAGGDVNVVGATDLQISGSSRRFSFLSGTGTIRTTTSNSLIFQTNSTTALTLNSSQNATFPGIVDVNSLQIGNTTTITSGRALENLTSISLAGTALTGGELPSNLQGNYVADHMSHTDPSNASRNYCLTMFKSAELWAKNASTQAWSKISDTSTGTLGNILRGYAGGQSSGPISLGQTYDEFIIYFGTGTSTSISYSFIGMMKLEHSTNGNTFVAHLETKESFTNVYESGWTKEYETNSISSWPGATSHKVSFGVGSSYRNHLRLRIVPNWQHASNGLTLYNVNILGNYGARSSLFNWAHDRKVTFNNNTIFQGGSAASPSLTCIGDEDTGIYFPAANRVGISTGGTLALTIDSSQEARFFEGSGANRRLYIYGNDNGTDRYGSLSVGTDGSFNVVAADTYLILSANSYVQSNKPHNFIGNILMQGTAVLDTSRNLTNINTISSGAITVNNDANALTINAATNGGTAQITMCDNGTNGSGAQKFYITHNHTDGASYGSGAVLRFHTTESTGTILADGKLMFSEGLYIKPSSGTGAGTVVIQDNGTYRAPDGTAALPGLSFLNDINTGIYRPTSDQLALSTGGVERFRIDGSGNTNIAQNENLIIGSGASNTGGIQLYLGHTTAYTLEIAGSTTAREVNFKGSGSSADYNFRFYNLSTGSAHLQVQGNVTAYASISDINRKENIEIIPDALEKVKKLDGITFNFKGDNKSMTGLIAQQVQEVLPEAVYETETLEGEPTLALHYANTVGLLVEAIKTLEAQVSSLTKKIEKLENDKDN